MGSKGKTALGFGNRKIYYEVSTSKSDVCLVFLHGLGGSLTAWKPEIRFFRHLGYSTIGVDLRGHGKSEKPQTDEDYSFQIYAQDVKKILEQESFKSYVLVGHCFGGMVAMVLEGLFPKSGKALILVDSAPRLPLYAKLFFDNPVIKRVIPWLAHHFPNFKLSGRTKFEHYKGFGDWYAPRLIEDMLHTSLQSYFLSCTNLIGYDATKLIKNITIPTLVIEGSQDTIFPPEVAADLSSRIKSSLLDVVPDANHVIVINNPNELNTEIQKFLNLLRLLP